MYFVSLGSLVCTSHVVDALLKKMYTVEEVAEQLRVHVKTVRRWIASGELKAFDSGKGYRISESNLAAFIEQRSQRKKPDDEE